MRSYICFYKGRKIYLDASSSYEAQEKAAIAFKARKKWDVAIVLADTPINPASI